MEPSLLPCICTVVHVSLPCADNTGIVDRPLRLHRQLGACPHSSRETSESSSCLSNPLVDFCIQGEVVGDCGDVVGELADSIEFVVVNANDRRRFCVLSQGNRLLQTDDQSEIRTGL